MNTFQNIASIFSTIIVAAATIALAFLTAWYARHTKRIADVMVKDYESRISPLVELVKGNGSINLDSFEQAINIFNRGNVVVFVRNIQLRLYLKDRPSIFETIALNNNTQEIFPESNPINLGINIRRNQINNQTIRSTENRFRDQIQFKVEMEIAGSDGIYKTRFYDI